MADLPIILPLDFSEVLRKLEVSDPAHADLFNGLFQRLLTNDVFLKGMVEGLEQEIGNLDVATQAVNGLMSSTDKKKLDGIAAGANNYTHPATHPASIITESATKRFVSDTEKANWNGKLGASAQAADSAKLGGQLPSYYAKVSDLSSFSWELLRTITSVASGTREISIPISGEYSSFMINTRSLNMRLNVSGSEHVDGRILYGFKIGSNNLSFKGYYKTYTTNSSSAPGYLRHSTHVSFPYQFSLGYNSNTVNQTLNLTFADVGGIVSGLTDSTRTNSQDDFTETFGVSLNKPVGYISEITISLTGDSRVSFSSTSSTSIKVWGRK